MKYLKFLLIVVILSLTACKTQQTAGTLTSDQLSQMQGGMWVPSELEGMNETEMRILGSKLSASDIYHTSKPSIKDAIVQFNGGCTAEIISDQGLLLTNHHCGYGAIQSHSSVANDYLADGFWAKNNEGELVNPNMYVTFVVSMEDVTEQMFENTGSLKPSTASKQIQKNKKIILDNVHKKDWQEAEVKSFSKGNRFYLIITEDYKDIRLVGAPPSSIGKFGADTDNWMWPRHSGDFSLFRIYADRNNNPSVYNKDNVPYKPKHFLPISLDGVEEDDFTLIFGFPGTTDEYLPAVAIEQIVNKLNPDKIALREATLAIMDKHMRRNERVKIQYASKYARIANYWKKWIGESQGLKQSKAIEKKKAFETEFQSKVKRKKLHQYKSILSDFENYYVEYGNATQARDYWIEVVYRNIELLNLSFQLYRLEQTFQKKGVDAFVKEKKAFVSSKEGFFKNYNKQVDQEIFAKLMYMYDSKYATTKISEEGRRKYWIRSANEIYSKSMLTSYMGLKSVLEGNAKEVISKLQKDPAYKMGKQYSENFYKEINPRYLAINDKLAPIQKQYVKAIQELFPEKRVFPDANSTLRITYGRVKGYSPKDGMEYLPVSYLDGIIEKYVPGDYEFDVSKKLQDLYATKNYGKYQYNGKMPVNFLGTNHTTGGNSGSPVLDANGNLIGLNFDRVWEGTMSDYNYDANICRNIMVDARYIMFIIDKYAGAKHLIDEMIFVHPKK